MLKVGLSNMGMSVMDIHYSESRSTHAKSQQLYISAMLSLVCQRVSVVL